jgi:imidazolonepropionase-like amidohydrolase
MITRRGFIKTASASIAVAGAMASLAAGQGVDAGLVLRGATVYAAPDTPPIRDAIVVTRKGRIEAVGERSAVTPPAAVPIVDLTGHVLVAGFWNSHVHFSEKQLAQAAAAPAAQLTSATTEMLTRWGFTSVFDTGSDLANTLALKKRIDGGEVDGPLIFTAGDILYPKGATGRRFRIETPDEAAAAVEALLDGGADGVKVYAQAFWDLNLKLSPQVLAAVRAETRRRKVPMLAHPSNREGLYNSIDAGVDMLVHTTPQIGPWGPELVAKMRASNIALIPTLKLWRFELMKDKAPAAVIEQFQQRGVAQLREYFSAGGQILFGTDVGYMTDYSTEEEYTKMAEAGMGYRDILASLTTIPAARHGRGERLGRVAVGFDADVAVLRSDPIRRRTSRPSRMSCTRSAVAASSTKRPGSPPLAWARFPPPAGPSLVSPKILLPGRDRLSRRFSHIQMAAALPHAWCLQIGHIRSGRPHGSHVEVPNLSSHRHGAVRRRRVRSRPDRSGSCPEQPSSARRADGGGRRYGRCAVHLRSETAVEQR